MEVGEKEEDGEKMNEEERFGLLNLATKQNKTKKSCDDDGYGDDGCGDDDHHSNGERNEELLVSTPLVFFLIDFSFFSF